MTEIVFPESLERYFSEKPISEAVDTLLDKLDGSKMPDFNFDEARAYNDALLMAALTRKDFVGFLFSAFDMIWPKKRMEAWESSEYSPESIWDYHRIGKDIKNSLETGSPEVYLYLSTETENTTEYSLFMRIFWDFDSTEAIDGERFSLWHISKEDDEPCIQTKPFPASELSQDCGAVISELKRAAEEALSVLAPM